MSKGRKQVKQVDRFEVFKRDGFKCQYCGSTPPTVVLVVDHIVPVKAGGTNHHDNLITACEPCNQGKAARSLEAIPQSLKERAIDIGEKELQIRGYQEILRAREERIEGECWEVADMWIEFDGTDQIRRDYFQSIRRFIDRLGVIAVKDLMRLALARGIKNSDQAFRYFCGCCWGAIRAEAAK